MTEPSIDKTVRDTVSTEVIIACQQSYMEENKAINGSPQNQPNLGLQPGWGGQGR